MSGIASGMLALSTNDASEALQLALTRWRVVDGSTSTAAVDALKRTAALKRVAATFPQSTLQHAPPCSTLLPLA